MDPRQESECRGLVDPECLEIDDHNMVSAVWAPIIAIDEAPDVVPGQEELVGQRSL